MTRHIWKILRSIRTLIVNPSFSILLEVETPAKVDAVMWKFDVKVNRKLFVVDEYNNLVV